MASQRNFIANLRRTRFGIGQPGGNPLAPMLQETIKLLSAELYQKDIHFISELLQNAEDNTYLSSVVPGIKIVLTKSDLTGTGAAATLVLFNNEVGFSERNIEALCSAGQSTKKGKKAEGYIGEKGIGFKSVFLVTKQPYIISNGFRIRFNEEPDKEASIGYILPEWVEQPSDDMLRSVYGSTTLPATTVILPLLREKIQEVSQQLIKIPAETLLFLSKLSSVSIYDQLSAPSTDLVLSRTLEMSSSKSDSIETCTASLTSKNGNREQSSNYYIFKQTFDVPAAARVEKRQDVKHWTISLAFPVEERVQSTRNIGDIFSFLPSDVHSGLPFIINSDFLLVSSRETLLFDSPWNQGIFGCIPEVYVNSFNLMVNSKAFASDAPSFALLGMYKFVPVNQCSNYHIENLRQKMIALLKASNVILCATDHGHRPRLCKPALARKVVDKFRDLLTSAPSCPSSLPFLVDKDLQGNHGQVLRVLGVSDMQDSEYFNALKDPKWLKALSGNAYVNLLRFLESRGTRVFDSLRFFKYLDADGQVNWASMTDMESRRAAGSATYWDSGRRETAWLANWNSRLRRWLSFSYIPSEDGEMIQKDRDLKTWLQNYPFYVSELTTSSFANQVLDAVTGSKNAEFVTLVGHFLFDLYSNDRGAYRNVSDRIPKVPVVDSRGYVVKKSREGCLLPAYSSKWPVLLPGNAWSSRITKMSDDYMTSPALSSERRDGFLNFLNKEFGAVDILELRPVNEGLPADVLDGSVESSTMLLDWFSMHCVSHLSNLLDSVRRSNWVKTSLGYTSPCSSFLPTTEMLGVFHREDVPFVDYEKWIVWQESYGTVLECFGAVCKLGQGSKLVVERLRHHESLRPEEVKADVVCRLYKYLSQCLLYDGVENILVPRGNVNSSQAAWIRKKDCLLHDPEGMFKELKLVALDEHYDEEMLPVLKKLGVVSEASVDRFCELWLAWSKKGADVEVSKCCTVWRQLVSPSAERCTIWKDFTAKGLIPSIPAFQSDAATVKLLPATKTIISDQLELEHLFKDSTPCPWVAWYPASEAVSMQELYKVYSAMGVRKLSEKVNSRTDSSSMSMSMGRVLVWEGGYINRGLFKAILAYLAAASLSVTDRQTLMLPLLGLREVQVETALTVHLTLQVGEQTYQAVSKSMLFWNAERLEIAYIDEERRRNRSTDFATEFAKTVATGLLSERRKLVGGLQELLAMLVFSKFSLEEVENTLIRRNMRVFSEDEQFLKTGVVFTESIEAPPKKAVQELEPFPVQQSDEVLPAFKSPPEARDVAQVTTRMSVSFSAGTGGSHSRTIAPRPPPPDTRKQLLQEALAKLNRFKASGAWTLEISDETFNSEKLVKWRQVHLPVVRQALDYPPEEGYVKPGMRPGFQMDKLLAAAFLSPGVFRGTVKGASHEHLSVVGAACLNLFFATELVKFEKSGEIFRSLDKLTNDSLLVAGFRASGLDRCVLLEDHSAGAVGVVLAANVFKAIVAVGFCAYDNGLEEVRRIYEEVFLAALSNALG